MSKFNFCCKFLLADLIKNLNLTKCILITVTTIIKIKTGVCFEMYNMCGILKKKKIAVHTSTISFSFIIDYRTTTSQFL